MEREALLAEIDELRTRLEEAEGALAAIRNGEVDALVVSSSEGERIFTLEGADQPYRVLVETMSEGAATLSADGTVLYSNSRLADLLGLPLERILGKPLLTHVSPADAAVLAALLKRALRADCRFGESFRAELALLPAKGGAIPALLSCCSLDLTGDRGISMIVTDLSEQKRTEEIVAAEEFASSILEQAGEVIIVCDEAGRVVRASRQSHELFGANPLFQFFDDLGELREAATGHPFSISAPLSGQKLRGVEVTLQRHGKPSHFLLNARPFLKRQQVLGCVVTLTDISERKRTEDALQEAKASAEDASRAKSEFLANMSHEIRTPMTVFMAAVEHLLLIDRNPERRHLLGMADQSARRLRALIDDILDFSRIEARKVELDARPFELVAGVREAIDMLALPAREKNLRLELEVAPTTPRIVIGDPDRLGQVLVNLIGNAIKFTPAGEVRVCVQPRGNLLEFAVADTGIGIPEEKSDLLFESFSQVDSSFTRNYGGTGLGLAISKGLVELMGGEIAVRSRQGQGSVFTFTLPLETPDRQGAALAGDPPPEAGAPPAAARILLAEDEPMIREMITMMLARKGKWQVDSAETGKEALAKWEGGQFDVIFMDLQMPEMNGLEATRTIREREAGAAKRICIIGLTAHARSDIRDECLLAGMDRVLTKPVQMTDLFSAIDWCL